MTYEEFESQVSAYLDGELGPVDQAAMEQKAAESEACQALLDDVRTITDHLSRLPEVQPSAEFNFALRSHLLLEVSGEQRPLRKVRRVLFGSVFRTITTLAAAVVLGLGLSGLTTPQANAPVGAPTALSDAEFNLVPGQPAPNHLGALERLSKQSYRLNHRLYSNIDETSGRLDSIQVAPPQLSPWLLEQQDVKQIPASYSF
jgi:hypothetical protein